MGDLKSPRQAQPDALVLGQVTDVLPHHPHTAGIGRKHSGDEIDQGGFTGTIGPDQTHTFASIQLQGHVAGDMQAAKRFAQTADVEHWRRIHRTPLGGWTRAAPSEAQRARQAKAQRSRGNSTTATSKAPMMNNQW